MWFCEWKGSFDDEKELKNELGVTFLEICKKRNVEIAFENMSKAIKEKEDY